METIKDLADSSEEATKFASHFYYQAHNVTDTEHYSEIKRTIHKAERKISA